MRSVADSFFTAKISDKKSILDAKALHPDLASEAGLSAALLGKMYWRGEGYEIDEVQALSWFKKGAILVRLSSALTCYLIFHAPDCMLCCVLSVTHPSRDIFLIEQPSRPERSWNDAFEGRSWTSA